VAWWHNLWWRAFCWKRKRLKTLNTKPRVAFISVYNTPCGIATYNQELLEELRHYADIKVFAEYADDQRESRLPDDPHFVVRCWDRKTHPKKRLISEIEKFQPDVVHIGHEYGFFPKSYFFTSLVSALKMRGYPVVATMHSIYDHRDKTVQEASGQHIIAHTLPGKVTLVKKGVPEERVTVIPHGTGIFAGSDDNPELLPAPWNTWGNDHTLFHPGFLFGYKGHMRMLDVVYRLKQEFPDVHYIVQASENPHTMAEHDAIYRLLTTRIEELGLEGNVTINRGFAAKEVLMSYIRTVKCVVLPYANHPDHDVRATSGIARLVMGTETPMVVTNVHLFDDLEGLVPRAASDDELYEAIRNIFLKEDEKARQISYRKNFLRKTSWSAVAYATAALYHRLVEERV
jgi:glycosyltransferase involved in cell wall biosynthesis